MVVDSDYNQDVYNNGIKAQCLTRNVLLNLIFNYSSFFLFFSSSLTVLLFHHNNGRVVGQKHCFVFCFVVRS